MMIIDITRTMQEAPIYPGSSPVEIQQVTDMGRGDVFNSSLITIGSHMGTHADAYTHFLPAAETAVSIDKMELWRYYGPCRVIAISPEAPVTRADLEGRLDGTERIALHTGGLGYLTADAARYIADRQIKLLATDAWSVGPLDNEVEIHQILLRAGIAIIENVTLEGVDEGDYLIAAFPVKYGGCDGAPVRAVLIRE